MASMEPRFGALGILIALSLGAGCGVRAVDDTQHLRVGVFPNVTHETALVARQRGTFAAAERPLDVEWKVFASGPQAIEALFAGALDACYLGPGPATNGYLRSHGEALVIVAGASEGGAALVVRQSLGVRAPSDLHGKTLASPQLGNTQDVALRSWLLAHGLDTVERGGDVRVLPMASPEILALMRRGDVDGAWVPEPWIARLVKEAGGTLFVDEKDLWPDGRFPSAVLVASRPSLAAKRDALARLVGAHVDETRWIAAHHDEARGLCNDAIRELTGKALPDDVMAQAFDRVHPTWDPLPSAIARMAEDARRLRYLPDGDLAPLIDRSLLDAALAARGIPVAGGGR